MKKVFAAILAVLYLGTSTGATIHLHYCMGKLFSWSLTDKETTTCGKCGMPKDGKANHCMSFTEGCCKDAQTHVQLDKAQRVVENNFVFSALSFDAVPMTDAFLPARYVVSYIAEYPKANAPPDARHVPLFLRNRTFLI